MVLFYKTNNDEYYTLTELAQQFPNKWRYAITEALEEKKYTCIIDLLAEAADAFEEILADDHFFIEPMGSLSNDDLNVLLNPLWN